MNTCVIEGCDKPARSATAEWCKMHYHRWYRHGSTDRVATTSGITASHGRKYKQRYVPGHPLACKSGVAYEHRLVLFDAIGPGPHECFWCGTVVEWQPKGHPLELQPDHLNGHGDDNRIENLVPACRRCNTTRGMQHRADALRSAGWWSNNDTIAGLNNGGRHPRIDDERALA